MSRTKRTFIVTIEGDSDGRVATLDAYGMRRAITTDLYLVPLDVNVTEVAGNIDVHAPAKRKPNPKVNANHGLDLDDALAIVCQEPMSPAQKQHRDNLIVSALDAGLTTQQLADKTGLTVQSISLIRREHRAAASRAA